MTLFKSLLPALILALAAASIHANGPEPSSSRPDILLIIADDLGFSDLGSYGSEIATPHLDRLASEGLRFNQFYTAAKCEPTRASLMTGLYWPVTKLGAKRGASLGEVLQTAGYQTLALGKWHLDGHPMDRGFDHFFGHLAGASSYFPPLDERSRWRLDREPFEPDDRDFYATDAFARQARDWILESKQSNPDRPTFTYLAFNAPHSPLQAPADEIDKYRGLYLQGWNTTRLQRFERQRALGIIDEKTALSAHPENIPAWQSLSPAQQQLEDLRMATYAAMITRMDAQIGWLLRELIDAGAADNLIVFFMSDNGASPYARTDTIMLRQGILPVDRNSHYGIGTGWANVSNTPFRLYKRNQHEGGVRSPFIVWSAQGLAPAAGSIHPQKSHIIDLMPTLAELAGLEPDEINAGKPTLALPGYSLTPVLQDGESFERGPLFFQLYDHRGLRDGNWKLASVDGKPWELYDLATDGSETRNLAPLLPATVSRLSEEWDRWWRGAFGAPYSQRWNPTPPADLRDDRHGGAPYEPSAMPQRSK